MDDCSDTSRDRYVQPAKFYEYKAPFNVNYGYVKYYCCLGIKKKLIRKV